MGLPVWVLAEPCNFCKAPLKPISVRGLDWKMNAQHLGNIVVEIMCQECKAGYAKHYVDCCHSVDEFIQLLKSPTMPVACGDESITHSQNNLMSVIYAEERAYNAAHPEQSRIKHIGPKQDLPSKTEK
jgi:hypothetical protein